MRLMYGLIMLCLFITACAPEGEPAHEEHGEEMAADVTNRIDIPATIRRNLGITFSPVKRRRVASTIRTPGSFELQPLARHEYRMTLPGWVELLIDQYDPVEPGDILYRFRSPEWPELQHEIIAGEQAIDTARAEIEVARTRIEETEKRLAAIQERLESLARAEFRQADLEAEAMALEASLPRLQAELQLARTTLTNAELTREHALHRASAATGLEEQELIAANNHSDDSLPRYRSVDWIEVRASERGVVETLAVTDGAFVETPSAVLSTVDPQRIRFRGLALQADMSRLSTLSDGLIVPPDAAGFTANDAVSASVTLGLEAHPEQRTITLLATPSDVRPWMRPGVSAFLEIEASSTEGPALAIPRAAIVRDGITHVFFRRDPENPIQAIRVEAEMGVSDGRWVEIRSGVSPTDEIVLDGAYELKLASQQQGEAPKGGHFHSDGTFHGDH